MRLPESLHGGTSSGSPIMPASALPDSFLRPSSSLRGGRVYLCPLETLLGLLGASYTPSKASRAGRQTIVCCMRWPLAMFVVTRYDENARRASPLGGRCARPTAREAELKSMAETSMLFWTWKKRAHLPFLSGLEGRADPSLKP